MNNTIRLIKTEKKDNLVNFVFEATGEITKYLYPKRNFAIEYPFSINDIPEGILNVTFVGNFLPFVFLFDVSFFISILDKTFYECIDEVKKGYIDMYPAMKFNGKISVDEIQDNTKPITDTKQVKTASFFSGGVDAYTTLLRHIDESPYLITLRGADIKLNDLVGWSNLWSLTKHAATEYNLENIPIASEFRQIFNEGSLIDFLIPSKDRWWHGFHHGIGIISHGAVPAYKFNISTIYIASSFSIYQKNTYTCASDPTIDNHIRFGNTQIVHDGYELNRQDKIHFLCGFKNENGKYPPVHVCFESSGGKNCCHCEKCYRTIIQIIAEGADPNNFNFIWDKEAVDNFRKRLETFELILNKKMIKNSFKPAQELIKKNKALIPNYSWYEWYAEFDFEDYSNKLSAHIKKKYSHPRIKKVLKKVGLFK